MKKQSLFLVAVAMMLASCGSDVKQPAVLTESLSEVVESVSTESDGAALEEVEETNEVAPQYECVDLGLSVKWATCNVGASSPEEYGDYFAWGETKTKTYYYGDKLQMTSDISGNSKYDAARAKWGGSWRMPTESEAKELVEKCTWTKTTQNDVEGYNVEGTSGASIFLPAAGYKGGGLTSNAQNAGTNGEYWTSTPDENSEYNSRILYFGPDYWGEGEYHRVSTANRSYGYPIRPVMD